MLLSKLAECFRSNPIFLNLDRALLGNSLGSFVFLKFTRWFIKEFFSYFCLALEVYYLKKIAPELYLNYFLIRISFLLFNGLLWEVLGLCRFQVRLSNEYDRYVNFESIQVYKALKLYLPLLMVGVSFSYLGYKFIYNSYYLNWPSLLIFLLLLSESVQLYFMFLKSERVAQGRVFRPLWSFTVSSISIVVCLIVLWPLWGIWAFIVAKLAQLLTSIFITFKFYRSNKKNQKIESVVGFHFSLGSIIAILVFYTSISSVLLFSFLQKNNYYIFSYKVYFPLSFIFVLNSARGFILSFRTDFELLSLHKLFLRFRERLLFFVRLYTPIAIVLSYSFVSLLFNSMKDFNLSLLIQFIFITIWLLVESSLFLRLNDTVFKKLKLAQQPAFEYPNLLKNNEVCVLELCKEISWKVRGVDLTAIDEIVKNNSQFPAWSFLRGKFILLATSSTQSIVKALSELSAGSIKRITYMSKSKLLELINPEGVERSEIVLFSWKDIPKSITLRSIWKNYLYGNKTFFSYEGALYEIEILANAPSGIRFWKMK